jgi:DNA-binding CsgD family transcriptional regulator
VVIIDTDGRIESMTAAGETLLEHLRTPRSTLAGGVPLAVFGVATRARAASAAQLRVRTSSGTWLTLHGAPRQTPDGLDARVMIVLQPSRQSDILGILGRRFGWSPREQQVVGLIMSGLSTRHIAQQLRISEHTVQDHLKSIFDKTGVRGRRQLAMTLATLSH